MCTLLYMSRIITILFSCILTFKADLGSFLVFCEAKIIISHGLSKCPYSHFSSFITRSWVRNNGLYLCGQARHMEELNFLTSSRIKLYMQKYRKIQLSYDTLILRGNMIWDFYKILEMQIWNSHLREVHYSCKTYFNYFFIFFLLIF